MEFDAIRGLEHVHGHLGWLATAALVHPAVLLRNRARRAHLAATLPTIVVTIASALGARVYVDYREHLRPTIFANAPAVGLLFERKEHLAVGAVACAWMGTVGYLAAARAAPELRLRLRRLAWGGFAMAAFLSAIVAIAGTVVAIYKGF